MILSIAWKNIWRNKLRSLVVIFAVIIGLMAGSFGVALMEGMAKSRTKTQLNNEISHIQIHKTEFTANYESKYFMDNFKQINNFAETIEGYKSAASRLIISGMLNTTGGNTGAMIYGINPEKEKTVTEIYKFVKDSSGGYFNSERKNQVLISETTAKKLKLDRYVITPLTIKALLASGFPENDTSKLSFISNTQFRTKKEYFNKLRENFNPDLVKEYEFLFVKYAISFKKRAHIVITFQDINGKITGDKFRVTGIYRTSNRMFDEMSVFVNKKDLCRLTGFKKTESHEIAILLKDRDMAKSFAEKLRKKFPELKIDTWEDIDPMLVMLANYMDIYNYLIIAIIMAALAFGIINTMLMAIMERTKELGMLAAIGMNRKRIFKMIMLETVLLTLTGAIVGLIGNYFLISKLGETGIDLTKQMGEAFEAIGFDSLIYPEMALKYYIGITLLVIVTAVLSSIYPAVKAIKLNPAEAVRSDA